MKENTSVFLQILFMAVFLWVTIAEAEAQQWTREKAWEWYHAQPWSCGFNYVPANAISYTEMWMDYSFNETTINAELELAEQTGFNCLRVVLPFVVWEHEPAAFEKRFNTFLSICDRHKIRVIPCFFDDCVFGDIQNPEYGKQPEVVPGWYANGWTPSPGHARAKDPAVRPSLEAYVKDLMKAHREDKHILCWDLYNEPTNSGMGEDAFSLLHDVFRWAREIDPVQPITTGVWNDNEPLNRFLAEQSDITSFHCYRTPEDTRKFIQNLHEMGRPMVCTEWLNRPLGSTVESCLPIYKDEEVGCLHWGLVNGKTQTHLPWGHRPGDSEPKVWQHDLYRGDYTPYAASEIVLFKAAIQQPKNK